MSKEQRVSHIVFHVCRQGIGDAKPGLSSVFYRGKITVFGSIPQTANVPCPLLCTVAPIIFYRQTIPIYRAATAKPIYLKPPPTVLLREVIPSYRT